MTATLSGCVVVFTNLPADTKHTGVDKRLLGRWAGQDEQGNRGFIGFDLVANNEIDVSILGEKSDLGYKNPVFRMATTEIDNHDYMFLRAADSPPSEGSVIARYAIENGRLTIWILSVDKVKQAIENGKLKGAAGGGPFGGLTITNTSEQVSALLKSADSKALFVCLGEFQKVPV
ncbi:MAG TPA: hypothetical protein VFZ40_20175 [Pyrinomonadaceae bacterium]